MRRRSVVSQLLLAVGATSVVLAGCCLPGGEPPDSVITGAVTSAQPTPLFASGSEYSGQATITLTNSTGSTLTGPITYSIDEPSGYSVNPVPGNECSTLAEGSGLADGASCSYDVAITALGTTPAGTANDVTVHLTWAGTTVTPDGVVVHTTTVVTS